MYARNYNEPVSKPSASQKPVLVLFNRKKDIQGMLYHSWKYLSLIHDVFGIKNNTIEFNEEGKATEHLELDFASDADKILQKNAFIGFHQAGPNVDASLSEWTREYEKFGGQKQGESMTDLSSDLTNAIDKLPQMTEGKKKIDMHVKLATTILTNIKSRSLDKLQDIEDEIMTTRKLAGENKDDLLTILRKPSQASPDKLSEEFIDKARVLLIMILCFGSKMEELKEYLEIVEGIHTEPLEVEALRKINVMFNKKQVSKYCCWGYLC